MVCTMYNTHLNSHSMVKLIWISVHNKLELHLLCCIQLRNVLSYMRVIQGQ